MENILKKKNVFDTDGSNLLDILAIDYIDVNNTFTNNIVEIYKVLVLKLQERLSLMN